jgi:ATP-dependent DNA helicase RecG
MGTGISRIKNALAAAGNPIPVFEFDTFFTVTFNRVSVQRPAAKGKATQETTQETTQEKIVMLLRKNPHMTRNELAASIGITPDGIKYHLEKLSKAKRIQHHGPTKKGSWQILQKE